MWTFSEGVALEEAGTIWRSRLNWVWHLFLCVCVCVLMFAEEFKCQTKTWNNWEMEVLDAGTINRLQLSPMFALRSKCQSHGARMFGGIHIDHWANQWQSCGKLLKHWALTLYNSWRKSQCQRHLCCKSVRCPVSSVMSNRNVIIRPNWMLVTDAVCEASYWTRYHMLLYSHFTVSFSCKSPWDLFGVNCTIWKCPNVWEVLKNC